MKNRFGEPTQLAQFSEQNNCLCNGQNNLANNTQFSRIILESISAIKTGKTEQLLAGDLQTALFRARISAPEAERYTNRKFNLTIKKPLDSSYVKAYGDCWR